MSKSEEMQRLEKDLRNSENLRRKWEETVKEIADKKIAKSDGEVLEMAAKKLGYSIKKASSEEIDEDELANVTGGEDDQEHGLCVAHYACFTAFLHPDQGKNGPCWSNYRCMPFEKC